MKTKITKILEDYLDIRISPLYNKDICLKYLEQFDDEDAKVIRNQVIDVKTLSQESICRIYHCYLLVVTDYIKKYNIHLEKIKIEKLFVEDDYEEHLIQMNYLLTLKDLNKIKVINVNRDGITYSTESSNKFIRLITDCSPYLGELEKEYFGYLLKGKASMESIIEDFENPTNQIYVYTYSFGDFNVPLFSHTLGFDPFCNVRNNLKMIVQEKEFWKINWFENQV